MSLAVPTYNRSAKLAAMLPALVSAVERHPRGAEFEICVGDNASTDDTPTVIAGCGVRSVRHAENLGFAGNFAALLSFATGDAFVVLADDDELLPGALDVLLDAAQRQPLVILNSLPGGDAVVRGQSLPDRETPIDGPGELLARVGIFQASFVSNLVFHRPSALAAWRDEFRRSRYPHTVLALELLKSRPAVYLPAALVKVTLPADTGDQPLLTAIDMARVMSDHALEDPRARRMAWPVYRFLLKMLPTAVYQRRMGRCLGDDGNPHASLRLSNVLDCYRHSRRARGIAFALWILSYAVPTILLGGILRRLSRHRR